MKKLEGFSLLELLIVMAVIGVLSITGWIAMQYGLRKARDTQRIQALKAIEQANFAYYNNHGTYLYMPIGGESNKCFGGYNHYYDFYPPTWMFYYNYNYWSTCLGNTVGEYTDNAVQELINNSDNYSFFYSLPLGDRNFGYFACTLLEISKYDPDNGYFNAIPLPWTPENLKNITHVCASDHLLRLFMIHAVI